MFQPAFRYTPIDYRTAPVALTAGYEQLFIPNNLRGNKLQITLSNRYGDRALQVQQVTVNGVSATFGSGVSGLIIPPGREEVSNIINCSVSPGEFLSVSLKVKAATFTTGVRRDNPRQIGAAFLTQIAVDTGKNPAKTIACLGDSITQQGYWFGILQKVVSTQYPGAVAMANCGISGNRVLNGTAPEAEVGEYFGDAMIARFQRDVLEYRPDLVMIHGGINDLIHPTAFGIAGQETSAQLLCGGLNCLIDAARGIGARVAIGTLLPFGGWNLWHAELEQRRQAVNDWIRTQRLSNFLIDFDAGLRDPMRPAMLRSDYDSGDGLHPSDLGGDAMASLVLRSISI